MGLAPRRSIKRSRRRGPSSASRVKSGSLPTQAAIGFAVRYGCRSRHVSRREQSLHYALTSHNQPNPATNASYVAAKKGEAEDVAPGLAGYRTPLACLETSPPLTGSLQHKLDDCLVCEKRRILLSSDAGQLFRRDPTVLIPSRSISPLVHREVQPRQSSPDTCSLRSGLTRSSSVRESRYEAGGAGKKGVLPLAESDDSRVDRLPRSHCQQWCCAASKKSRLA